MRDEELRAIKERAHLDSSAPVTKTEVLSLVHELERMRAAKSATRLFTALTIIAVLMVVLTAVYGVRQLERSELI